MQEAHAPGDPVVLDLDSEPGADLVKVQLHIACVPDRTEMLLSFDRTLQALGSEKRAPITHGFDSTEPDVGYMNRTTGGKDVALQNEQVFPILRNMANARQWFVIAADQQHTIIRAVFNVSGFDLQLPKIQKACHWQ